MKNDRNLCLSRKPHSHSAAGPDTLMVNMSVCISFRLHNNASGLTQKLTHLQYNKKAKMVISKGYDYKHETNALTYSLT